MGGDDILVGGAGNDALNGGNGEDTASYSTSPESVIVFLDSGWLDDTAFNKLAIQQFNDGFDGKNKLKNIENLTGSNHNNTLNGEVSHAWNSIINGLAGNDTISGNGGSYTLIGGAGNGSIIGGNGSDLVVINGFRWEIDLVWISKGGNFKIIDKVSNRDGTDSLSGVERLQFGYGTI